MKQLYYNFKQLKAKENRMKKRQKENEYEPSGLDAKNTYLVK